MNEIKKKKQGKKTEKRKNERNNKVKIDSASLPCINIVQFEVKCFSCKLNNT